MSTKFLYYEYVLLQGITLIAGLFDISWFFMGLEDFKRTVLRNTFVKIVSVLLIFIFVKSQGDTWKYILISGGSSLVGNLMLWPYLRNIIIKPKLPLKL
ncbi:hypothetical protein [Enterococcus casseliflavus]